MGQRTRRGLSWNLVGAVATNGTRIAVLAILGRVLTADDFGIVAAAISVNVILLGIRDVGVGLALVQRKELTPGHVSTAFALSTYLGIGLSALIALAAPWIGDWYGMPAATNVMRALGLLFVIRGVSTTSRMICQRDMNFRAIAVIDASTFCLGSATSIGLAILGWGPWALVAGYLVEEVLATVLYLVVKRPPFSLVIHRERLRELMSFGAGQTVVQICGIAATYGDNIVVGNGLGAAALGFYTRAYDLIRFPSIVFSTVVGSVLFPALSRFQDDRSRLGASFRRITFVNALVLFPASTALAILAPETIRILMGPGWEDAVLPFQILAATMLMRTTLKLGSVVATAAGQVNAVAIMQVCYMLATLGGAAVTVRWGLSAVATAIAVAITAVGIASNYLAIRVSDLTWREVIAAHLPGLALSGLVALACLPLTGALRAAGQPVVLIFVVVALVAVAICLAATVIGIARRRGDFGWLRDELGRLRRRPKPAKNSM